MIMGRGGRSRAPGLEVNFRVAAPWLDQGAVPLILITSEFERKNLRSGSWEEGRGLTANALLPLA